MKVWMSALATAMATAIAAPALAQTSGAMQIEVEGKALLDRYVVLFNRGDAAGLAKEVYADADTAVLAEKFAELRADSFGKLEVYDFRACPVADDRTKVQMNYARIYTFGGKMNEDEGKVFDLQKTPAGWRIGGEADATFGMELVCWLPACTSPAEADPLLICAADSTAVAAPPPFRGRKFRCAAGEALLHLKGGGATLADGTTRTARRGSGCCEPDV